MTSRSIFLSLILVGILGCVPVTAPQTPAFDAGEVVALIPDDRAASLIATSTARGYFLVEDSDLNALALRMLRFSIPSRIDEKGAIEELEAVEPSSTVGVNHLYRPATDETLSRFVYAPSLLQWPALGCRTRAPVGMLDTGIAADALPGNVIARDFFEGDPPSRKHGTDVAAVLLDPTLLAGTELYSAGVIERQADGSAAASVDSMIKALDWLSTQGVRIVNISLTGPYNKLLDRSVGQAATSGMVIVAAVGNDGAMAEPRYPAALNDVIAVTAVDANRNIFSSAVQGGHVDLAAPGVDILIVASGQARFATGTSMAVPYVTAVIATDPELATRPVAEVRAALKARAQDLGPPGDDPIFGSGLVVAPQECIVP